MLGLGMSRREPTMRWKKCGRKARAHRDCNSGGPTGVPDALTHRTGSNAGHLGRAYPGH